MSCLRENIITRLTTDLIGFGATLNDDGSISAITGATIEYVTAAPAAVRNAGSLALRNNGSLYVTTGAGTWFAIGGASGTQYADNVGVIWGTTSPLQGTVTYVSAQDQWTFATGGVSQATAQVSASTKFVTGNSTITGAVVGADSGTFSVQTGTTDSTNAGGTGGVSGAISFTTGNANSTLGTSGNTGAISLITGNSADANSGNIVFTTGTAAGTRGVVDVNAPTLDFVTQATTFDLIDNSATALLFRAGAGGTNVFGIDTTNGGEAAQAYGMLVTLDGVTSGNVRRVGGSILRTVAESVGVIGAEAAFAGGSVTLVANLPKVGTRIAFSALVRVAAVSGGPTAQIRIRIGAAGVGGTLAFDTTARTVADEDIIKLDGYLDMRTVGAPGSATGVCEYKFSAPDMLASDVAAEWGMDVAGSASGTWTVPVTTTGPVDVTITGQTDAGPTELMLESFRVWVEA